MTRQSTPTLINLIEVYVDKFIAMSNDLSFENLQRFSRAMLHGIHAVFPPPAITGHNGYNPIAVTKLKDGDCIWTFKKEVLGWDFDGLNGTIQLPTKKCDKIFTMLRTILQQIKVPLNTFQKLAGKLQHASLGMPGEKAYSSQLTWQSKMIQSFFS